MENGQYRARGPNKDRALWPSSRAQQTINVRRIHLPRTEAGGGLLSSAAPRRHRLRAHSYSRQYPLAAPTRGARTRLTDVRARVNSFGPIHSAASSALALAGGDRRRAGAEQARGALWGVARRHSARLRHLGDRHQWRPVHRRRQRAHERPGQARLGRLRVGRLARHVPGRERPVDRLRVEHPSRTRSPTRCAWCCAAAS